ncbi:MAG: SulP family inorganic anion transporter [Cumulibacter sp.]
MDSRTTHDRRSRPVGFLPRRRDIGHDLGAGLTVALVSVAEGMAYALVAGVDPIYGLYAGSVTVIVGSLLASTSLLLVTATNALALVTADKIGALGSDDPATAMFTLTLLVGVVMTILGLLRLGSLIRFISREISAALVTAVALLIVLGQYKDLVGYTSDLDGNKVRKAIDITAHLPSWDWPTVAIGVGCIMLIVLTKMTMFRSYADIVALVVGTAVVAAFDLQGIETIGDIASIPTGLDAVPTPHMPDLSLVPTLIPAAIAAAIVGLSEAATVGSAYPNRDGTPSDASRDFIAQGAANLVGGFFRTMVVAGSLSRTGVNVSASARSRWAGVYAGILLVILIVLAGDIAELIPLCTLAAILIVIGAETMVREVRHLIRSRFVSWPHLIAGAITVLVGVLDEITTAVFTGVGLSLLLFTLTMGDRLKITAWEPISAGHWRETTPPARLEVGSTTVLALSGSAYFASVYRASHAFPKIGEQGGAAVILQVRGRRLYSLTGVDFLLDLVRDLRKSGNLVILADAEPSQRRTFERTGLLAEVGEEHVIWRESVIGAAATEACALAQQWHSANTSQP